MRTIMTMGEVRGNMLDQKANGPSVFPALPMAAYMPKTMMRTTGMVNCAESSWALTLAPTAAKKLA